MPVLPAGCAASCTSTQGGASIRNPRLAARARACGHGTHAYHYDRQPAFALWASGPAYGMDANMLLAWHRFGGGRALLQKLYSSIGADVVSLLSARCSRSRSARSAIR
jgi:hypothetical protein